ncbi:MAG: hypothetical protein LBH43_05585 [Treponema sp.]|nr:hypothetical protein [Treponema sp.]
MDNINKYFDLIGIEKPTAFNKYFDVIEDESIIGCVSTLYIGPQPGIKSFIGLVRELG